jgi:cytochrome c-type biogenesis protein CcmH/NrfG
VALGRDEIRHLITLGEARLALGDEAGAAEAYGAVLALDPENPEAHLELGIINERKGEMERAEEHFVESLKVDPANPRALYSYASLYYTADDLEAAEEILERAIAADARYSPALSALASIQARRGEYGDALDYIEKAVDAGESDVEHFRSALEFAPLHADPRFRTLLSRMVGDRSNGHG